MSSRVLLNFSIADDFQKPTKYRVALSRTLHSTSQSDYTRIIRTIMTVVRCQSHGFESTRHNAHNRPTNGRRKAETRRVQKSAHCTHTLLLLSLRHAKSRDSRLTMKTADESFVEFVYLQPRKTNLIIYFRFKF